MTIVSVRSFKILTWLLPVLVVIAARNLLLEQVRSVYARASSVAATAVKIRSTDLLLRELPAMKADYESLVRKKMAIASSLFGAKSEASLYELFMMKAKETEVLINSVTPYPRRRGTGFTELPLTLEVSGSFDNLARFTSKIENVNRLMRVEELTMARSREGALMETIRLLVFMYADTAAAQGSAKQQVAASFVKRRESYREELQKALGVNIAVPSFDYQPSGKGDPFGVILTRNTESQARQVVDTSKKSIGMILKGILWKEVPLAILETIDGRTVIVRQGETINDCKVSAIARTEVTIATPHGNHVLHQYNEK